MVSITVIIESKGEKMKKDQIKPRHIEDISYDELNKALAQMCEDWGIVGSYAGSAKPRYNLFAAICLEKAKISPNDPFSKKILAEFNPLLGKEATINALQFGNIDYSENIISGRHVNLPNDSIGD